MPSGGKRKGAGRKSGWASGCRKEDTQTMRIPRHILKEVHEAAHRLDAGEKIDWDAQSKILSLQKKVDELERKNSQLNQTKQLEMIQSSVFSKEHLNKIKDDLLKALPVSKSSPVYKDRKNIYESFIKAILQVM